MFKMEPATTRTVKAASRDGKDCCNATQRQAALIADESISHVRLRKPTSTTGAQRKYQTAGASASALTSAMRSTGNPALRSRYGIAVLMNPL